jgi:glycosyltransferase involved in cell wall biosynthesis
VSLSTLHVLDSLHIGGLERVVVSLANGLQQRGLPQTVCCLRQAGPLARELGADVRLVELNARGRDWSLARRLHDLIARISPDVVHGENLGTWSDVVRAAHGRFPVVQSFHGFLGAGLPLPRRFLVRRLAGQTDQMLAVSHALAAETARRFRIPLDDIVVVPNGIDTDHFAPGEGGPAEQSIHDLVGGRFLCVTVASLSPAKSPETLIRAAMTLPDDIAFMWVGDGPLARATRRQIEQCGLKDRFFMPGAQSDIRPYLRAADVFVLCSRTEALPVCLLESQAVGLPAVATNVGDVSEIVVDGDSGLLAPPEDPEALATGICELKSDSAARARMSSAARNNIMRRHTLDAMIDRYVSVYETVGSRRFELAGAVP